MNRFVIAYTGKDGKEDRLLVPTGEVWPTMDRLQSSSDVMPRSVRVFDVVIMEEEHADLARRVAYLEKLLEGRDLMILTLRSHLEQLGVDNP